MPETRVGPSAANVAKGSAVYEIARIVNDLQAAVVEIKGDYNGAATLLNELKADFNALRGDVSGLVTLANEVKTDYNAAVTLMNELKLDFNSHTHKADGAQVGAYNTSKPTGLVETIVAGASERVVAAADAGTVAVAAPDTIYFRTLGLPTP